MPTLAQFANRIKMRHDYSDMIQVRYSHTDGETYDTWVSGDEVVARLKTMSREQLIKSFSTLNFEQAKASLEAEISAQKEKKKRNFFNKMADKVEDGIGGNLLGDTLANRIRGVDGDEHPLDRQKAYWQNKLTEDAFRAVAIDLAWFNLEDSLPEEPKAEPDDWV
ncbi:MAG: hypothetical protein AAF490_25750 [Chloroflexota bacterium]